MLECCVRTFIDFYYLPYIVMIAICQSFITADNDDDDAYDINQQKRTRIHSAL